MAIAEGRVRTAGTEIVNTIRSAIFTGSCFRTGYGHATFTGTLQELRGDVPGHGL